MAASSDDKKSKKTKEVEDLEQTEVIRETKVQEDFENTQPKNPLKNKRKLPETSKLKKLLFKRNRLRKFRKNYGANLNDEAKYFLTFELAENYANKENENREAKVRSIRTRNKKTSKKKKWLNFLYFALNILVIGIVLGVQLAGETNPMEFLNEINNVNWWYILAALGLLALTTLTEIIRYSILIYKATGRFRIALSYKLSVVGRLYDNITPLSTGGQPFQTFYTVKYGIKASEGVSIAMGRYIFYQIVYFICISFILFRDLFTHSLSTIVTSDVVSGLVSTLSWIGYISCAVVIFGVVFISLNRRAGAAFIAGILRFVSKIKIGKFRIIKDYKSTFVNAMRGVNSWQATTKKYRKSFSVISLNVIFSLIFFFAWYTTPYFIYCAFNGSNPEMWGRILTMAVMIDLTSAFNPIPMGVGTADLSFTVLYGALFSTGAAVWALLIFRFFAYYIHLIHGFGLLTYDYLIGDKRLKKYKEFWMLPYRERVKIKFKASLQKLKLKKKKQEENKKSD